MRIDRGKVVTLDYELKNSEGEDIEDDGASVAYLHGGYGGIFPKVEEALEGQEIGFETSLTLEPDDAFGEYDADLVRIEPRSLFPKDIEVGMRFEGVPGEREEDAVIYTVTEITPEKVLVDGNHPFAGERLWFKCAVTDVRAATEEELTHGHVHGDYGVHAH